MFYTTNIKPQDIFTLTKEEVDFLQKKNITGTSFSLRKDMKTYNFGLGEKKIIRLELKVSLTTHSQMGHGV